MLRVGLIGPIGAGKSVVADELAARGAAVIRADEVSRELLVPGSRELEEIARVFGTHMLREDGTLKRRELAEVCFADDRARERLERIVHPPMVRRIREKLEALERASEPPQVAVVEAANLVQMGVLELVDRLVMVTAPRAERLRRIMERDGVSADSAERVVALQERQGIEECGPHADRVLVAEGDEESTRTQTQRLWAALVEESGRPGGRPGG